MKTLSSVVKHSLYRFGAIGLARHSSAPGQVVRVLRYHSVSTSAPWRADAISVDPATFAEQMRFVAENYTVISLDRLTDHLLGAAPLPPRAVCITFDDGYLDNHDHALPVLRDLNLPATFFIAAGPVVRAEIFWVGWVQETAMTTAHPDALASAFDLNLVYAGQRRQHLADALTGLAARRSVAWRDEMIERIARAAPDAPSRTGRPAYMMTPDHLIALHDAGMTVAAHTVTHPILASQDDATTTWELVEAKRLLEDVIGAEVRHLAYPNAPGVLRNYDDRTRALARAAGYHTCGTSRTGVVRRDSDAMALPRLGIHRTLDSAAFAFRLEQHRFSSLFGTIT